MKNLLLWFVAMLMVASTAAAATVTLTPSYGCYGDTLVITGAGFGPTNATNLTFSNAFVSNALLSTATLGITSCSVGTYSNASGLVTDATGAFTCNATMYANVRGSGVLRATDVSLTTASATGTAKCYAVTDLVSMGVDVAGRFMNAMVDQSSNIAMIVILGLIVTLMIGVIAAVGTIFVVFKLK